MPALIALSACLGFALWGWALIRMPSSGFDDVDRRQVWRAGAGLGAFVVAGGCALWRAFL